MPVTSDPLSDVATAANENDSSVANTSSGAAHSTFSDVVCQQNGDTPLTPMVSKAVTYIARLTGQFHLNGFKKKKSPSFNFWRNFFSKQKKIKIDRST